MREVVFLSSDAVWQHGHGPDHPLKPERLQRTHELLDEFGAFNLPNVQVIPPRLATETELRLFHDTEYIEAVRRLSDGDSTINAYRYGFGPGDNPIFRDMHDSERLKVGSAIQAAQLLVNGDCDVAFSYSGGLHHGGARNASGFCVYNDAAVAIHWLLGQGKRVAYVDIDVHHGDGVQSAFYSTDQVMTISLHQDGQTLFPGTGFVTENGRGIGVGYSINIPFPPYTGDASYLWAFNQVVPSLLERFQADIVVTQLGVDTHFLDPLANLQLTTAGHKALFKTLAELSPRWLALGGGGYEINVVPRSWAIAFGVMADHEFPDALPPGYVNRYGGSSLHDSESIQLNPAHELRVREHIESTVEQVKMSIFQ